MSLALKHKFLLLGRAASGEREVFALDPES